MKTENRFGTQPVLSKVENLLWLYIPIAVFTLLLILTMIFNLNRELFYQINSLNSYTNPLIWEHITILGDGLIAALLLSFWMRKNPQMLWSFFIASLFYMLILYSLKFGLNFKRPPAVLESGSYYQIGKALKSHSFPSGHTTTIFALGAVLAFYYKATYIRFLFILITLLIGISRIMVGVHWPVDVFAGAVLGWFSGVVGIYFAKRTPQKFCRVIRYALAFILGLIALIMVVKYKTGFQNVNIFIKLLGLSTLTFMTISFIKHKKNYLKYLIEKTK